MLKIKVNNNKELSVERKGKDLLINGEKFDCQIEQLNDHKFQIFRSDKIYMAEIEREEKNHLKLILNGTPLSVDLETPVDQLLKELGMSDSSAPVLKEVKAPMPGTILSLAVEPGQQVAKSDPLLILEAMKMENVIKSPGDGTVKEVQVKVGDNVDKNQVLVSFE